MLLVDSNYVYLILLIAGLAAALFFGKKISTFVKGYFETLLASSEDDTASRDLSRDALRICTVIILALWFGLWLATKACGFAPTDAQAMVVAISMAWALAYFVAGYFVGFLFGIPRVLQTDGPKNEGANAEERYEQRVNTNLEQISDWLTKIIVGLGLVQLGTLPEKIYRAAEWTAQSFTITRHAEQATPAAAAVSFAGALIVFFSIIGFLAGYLTTRLFLAGAFGRADRGAVIVKKTPFELPQGVDKTNVEKLREFAKSDENSQKLIAWLVENGGTVASDPPSLFNEPGAVSLRQKAVENFKI